MFQRFEWCPSVELLHVAKLPKLKPSKQQESYAKGSQKSFFSKKAFVLGFQKQRSRQFFWSLLGCSGREIRSPSVELLRVAKLQG